MKEPKRRESFIAKPPDLGQQGGTLLDEWAGLFDMDLQIPSR
jgi:hypothetical protein